MTAVSPQKLESVCTAWKRSRLWPGVRFGQDVDRIVVLNAESGSLYTLDGPGGVAWAQVGAADNRLGEYLFGLREDEQASTLDRLERLLQELINKKIVTTESNPAPIVRMRLVRFTQVLIRSGLRVSYRYTAAFVLAVVRLSLLTRGFGATLRVITSLPIAGRRIRQEPSQYVRAVSLAAALFPGRAECLEQSLTLVALLRSAGRATALEFGARAYPLLAHAWAECDGVAVNEHPDVVQTLIRLRGADDALRG